MPAVSVPAAGVAVSVGALTVIAAVAAGDAPAALVAVYVKVS